MNKRKFILASSLVLLLAACQQAVSTPPTNDPVISVLLTNQAVQGTAIAKLSQGNMVEEVTPTPGAQPTPSSGNVSIAPNTPVTTSGGGWQKIKASDLPDTDGYPGWIQMVGQQQSDGLPREVELNVEAGQIALMFGDEAVIPGMPVKQVGANHKSGGCYLLVIVGPAIWDTQPTTGEWEPINWPGRSAWDLHDADFSADPTVWMSQKALDLAANYPDTCGKAIDLWVYN